MYNPSADLPGGYSPNDGTIDFYSRVNCLVNSEMVALDFGAGRASWLEYCKVPYQKETRTLRGRVKKLIATDVDPIVMENKSADECIMMVGNKVPLADSSVDLIVADYVLEHIDNPKEFSEEVDRLLRPGGWFCARTPHKYNYVSLAARLVKNKSHAKVLSKIQPHRRDIDVFPTRYRLNSLKDVSKAFPNYTNQTFIYRADPAYFFGKEWIYKTLEFSHRLMPDVLCGNLFIFLQKPK